MNHKAKGISAERELIHKFWASGWAACRVAGSGSMKYPSPDIIAGTPSRRLAIECKASKGGYQYLTQDDLDQLKTFSSIFSAEPWFAVRFNNEGWYFVSLEDVAPPGKTPAISIETAKSRGLLFDELIGKFPGVQKGGRSPLDQGVQKGGRSPLDQGVQKGGRSPPF